MSVLAAAASTRTTATAEKAEGFGWIRRGLIGWLKAQNGPEAEFWIANGLAAAHLGWPTDQLREARNRAIELGWIEMIAQAAKGRNAVYRWGPTAKTSPWLS